MERISFINAPAGAGKTHALIREAHASACKGGLVIMACPTMDLIKQTISTELEPIIRFTSKRVSYSAIHSDVSRHVTSDATKFFSSFNHDGSGHILFLTHETIQNLPYVHRAGEWELVIDEAFGDAFRLYPLKIRESHETISSRVQWEEFDNGYLRLRPKKDQPIRRIAKSTDQSHKHLIDLCWDLIGNRVVLVDAVAWTSLLDGSSKNVETSFFSLSNPAAFHKFKSTTVACDMFRETMHAHVWRILGCEPTERRFPEGTLRYHSHGNGTLITIHHANLQRFTKRLRDKTDDTGKTVFSYIVEKLIPNGVDLVVMNNDQSVGDYFDTRTCKRLSGTPHGMNSFQEYHRIAFLSARNLLPPAYKFFKAFGVISDQVATATQHHPAYQAVMRISIRNPNDMSPKTVFVVDEATARYLQGRFPGATIVRHDAADEALLEHGPSGRPKIHDDKAAKQRASVYRRRIRAFTLALMIPSVGSTDYETTYIPHDVISYPIKLLIYADVHQSMPFHEVSLDKMDDLVAFMKDMADEPHHEKNEVPLFSAGDSRRKDEHTASSILVLDYDGGKVGPREFAAAIPFLKMVTVTTWSNTDENPRWRLLIPITRPVTYEEHRTLSEAIDALSLASLGLAMGPSARLFDPASFKAVQLYRLPCQRSDTGEKAMVDNFTGSDRLALDVDHWLTHFPSAPKPRKRREGASSQDGGSGAVVNEAAVQSAVSRWRAAPAGKGNDEFIVLGGSLKRAGMARWEVEARLTAEAAFGRSPDERKAQVQTVLKSLFG